MLKTKHNYDISAGFFVLLFIALITLVPFFWIVVSSFKTYKETVQIPVVFFFLIISPIWKTTKNYLAD